MKKTMLIVLCLVAVVAAVCLYQPQPALAQGTTGRALLVFIPECSGFDSSGNFSYCFTEVIYPSAGGHNDSRLTVSTLSSDTASAVLAKITDAAVTQATNVGFTVARTAILIPQYIRGQ